MANFERKDPSCIGKDGEMKAPEHRKAALKAERKGAINEPIRTEGRSKATIHIGQLKDPFDKRTLKVTLELELKDKPKGKALSISGNVWNTRHTDIISGGQNNDELEKALKDGTLVKLQYPRAVLEKLFRIWDKWHLNDLTAGCEHQEKLKEKMVQSQSVDQSFFYARNYEKVVQLKPFEKCPECGYKYGTAWLHTPLPANVVKFIQDLIDGVKNPAGD